MDPSELFSQLGLLYRKRRIELRIKARTLAIRAGISVDTLQAIENGGDTVKIGSWLAVAKELGLADAWADLLNEPPADPFEEFDEAQKVVKDIRKLRVYSKRKK